MPELVTWRLIWRRAISPQLETLELLALQAGLARDDKNIIQRHTTRPFHTRPHRHEEPQACCPLAYAIWKSADNIPGITIGEVEEHFARLCARADQIEGHANAVRFFLNWVDDAPRQEMVRELLAEVILALTARAIAMPSSA